MVLVVVLVLVVMRITSNHDDWADQVASQRIKICLELWNRTTLSTYCSYHIHC